MFHIKINGKQIKTTKRMESIESVDVMCVASMKVEHGIAEVLVNYLFDACRRCKGAIIYNGVIVRKEDIILPSF